MRDVAAASGQAALAFPNPYEHNPEFLINGNHVIEKKNLTPQQLEEIEAQIKLHEEEKKA